MRLKTILSQKLKIWMCVIKISKSGKPVFINFEGNESFLFVMATPLSLKVDKNKANTKNYIGIKNNKFQIS